MRNDVSKLRWLVRHARRTLRVIRQNIPFSLGVKAVFVLLTFVGYSSLGAAIAADRVTAFAASQRRGSWSFIATPGSQVHSGGRHGLLNGAARPVGFAMARAGMY
jgi:hypothetical protein